MSETNPRPDGGSSWALGIILKHGLGDFAISKVGQGATNLPFDIEAACREIDAAFERLKAERDELKVIVSGKTFSYDPAIEKERDALELALKRADREHASECAELRSELEQRKKICDVKDAYRDHLLVKLTAARARADKLRETLERAKDVIDFCYMSQPKNKHQLEIEQALAAHEKESGGEG